MSFNEVFNKYVDQINLMQLARASFDIVTYTNAELERQRLHNEALRCMGCEDPAKRPCCRACKRCETLAVMVEEVLAS